MKTFRPLVHILAVALLNDGAAGEKSELESWFGRLQNPLVQWPAEANEEVNGNEQILVGVDCDSAQARWDYKILVRLQ
jgi:hypothetical protein